MNERLAVWPPLPFSAYVHAEASLPFPLAEPGTALFARGRHALVVGLRALGLGAGDEVLVPAYHHGSEVEALIRVGLVPRFYEATETLAPDGRELDALLSERTRALYLIHYLGFPQDARAWRAWCDEHSVLLLEDAAQAWLATADDEPVGSLGDLAIFCLYKTVGLPDGAALRVRGGTRNGAAPAGFDVGSLARRHAAWVAGRFAPLGTLAGRLRAETAYRPEDDFAVDAPGRPAGSSMFLLHRVRLEEAAVRRRAHYRLLLATLDGNVRAPFDVVPEGASPFAYPLTTLQKDELLGRLRRAGIEALDFWSVPHPALPADRFPAAAERRATTVGLPVHQELRPADVDRIAVAAQGRRPVRAALEWLDDLEAAGEDWDELAERSGNVFSTHDWASLWWDQYGRGHRLLLAVCRRPSGERFAILPLYVARERPIRIVRFLGHGTADELGPVCAPADRVSAALALRRSLGEFGSAVFLADQVRSDEAWPALLGGGTVVRREAFPLLHAPGGWAAYEATHRSVLHKIAYEQRRLMREHEVRFRLAEDPATLESDLDTLFELHTARWQGETEFTEHETFHRALARRALDRGWLRLWFLELDGRPAAAWYGFRFAGVESHFQSGRDPAFERRSVGSVLLVHTIRDALSDGIREYRMLRGTDPYKDRFATEDPGIETVAVARDTLSRAALAGGRFADAVPQLRRVVKAGLAR